MRSAELELRVRDAVAALKTGHKIEDSTLELKAKWPDPSKKIARRLAGHANASHGDEIIWIFGIDENGNFHIPTDSKHDPANWINAVLKYFDSEYPLPITDKSIIFDDHVCHALVFDTSSPPYVVQYYKNNDGDLEVPWRRSTGIGSARREDLLRLLLEQNRKIEIELISCNATQNLGYERRIEIRLDCYLNFPSLNEVVLPFHKQLMLVRQNDTSEWINADTVFIGSMTTLNPNLQTHVSSRNIQDSGSEAIIHGPGRAIVLGTFGHNIPLESNQSAQIKLILVDPEGSIRGTITGIVPKVTKT